MSPQSLAVADSSSKSFEIFLFTLAIISVLISSKLALMSFILLLVLGWDSQWACLLLSMAFELATKKTIEPFLKVSTSLQKKKKHK